MEHGDISNASSPRLMVSYELVTQTTFTTNKFLGLTTGITTRRVFDVVALNRLWYYTSRSAVTLELINFGVDQTEATARLDELDTHFVNPFNHSTAWSGIDELLATLPYRPDVIGVADIPERQARYGLRGMGIDHLERVF